jgi:hypothetical protein
MMDYAGMHVLYQDIVIPAASDGTAPIASVTDLVIDSFNPAAGLWLDRGRRGGCR